MDNRNYWIESGLAVLMLLVCAILYLLGFYVVPLLQKIANGMEGLEKLVFWK
jgi:hypothetical protein